MTLRELLAKEKAYLAPAVFNPLCAKIAQARVSRCFISEAAHSAT